MFSSPKGILLEILGVVFFSSVYLVRIRKEMADFEVGYRAGRRLTAGEALYQPQDGHYMFKYFPSSALVYVPFSRLPLEIAKPVWYALSVAAAAWLLQLARSLVPQPAIASRYLAVLPPVILAKFFFHELNLGQVNIFVTVILLLAVRALDRPASRSKAIAGTLVGAATALKPYAALFLPYFVLKGQWRSLVAAFGFMALALVAPAVFYGFGGNLEVLGQWAATLSASTPGLLTSNDNTSVLAFFMKWTANPRIALVSSGVVLAGLAVLMMTVVAKGVGISRNVVLEGAMLLVLIPLVSPLGWDYTFLMSALGVTLLVNGFFQFSRVSQLVLAVNFAVVALVLSDLVGRAAYFTFMQWSVTTVNFIIVIVYLAYLRFRRVC